jgi:hypothetical protein
LPETIAARKLTMAMQALVTEDRCPAGPGNSQALSEAMLR